MEVVAEVGVEQVEWEWEWGWEKCRLQIRPQALAFWPAFA